MRRTSRRNFLSLCGSAVAVLAAARPAGAVKVADLQERLEKNLYCRRPLEFAFIDKVVKLVENGTLPLSMVNSTYDWARHKRPYPYQYFYRALRVRAAKIGVKLSDGSGT